MKRSLAAILIENSKVAKRVDGEMSSPSYDNMGTPDNHVKKSREVDGKRGLGDRPKSKTVSQVEPPKKKETRSMHEGAGKARPANMDGSSSNQTNRDEGMKKVSKKKKRVPSPQPPHKMSEDLGDSPDSDASMPFSSAKNKDEGMKKPKVDKKGATAYPGSLKGEVKKYEKNPANIGKTRKLPKSYTGGVNAPVEKMRESIQDLANFLGEIDVPADLMEMPYPDNFSQSSFDAHYGTDAEDNAYDELMIEAKTEVGQFLRQEGPTFLADYKRFKDDPRSENDPVWYMEHLTGLIDEAAEIVVKVFRSNEHDFDPPIDEFKPYILKWFQDQGIDEEHISRAFQEANYMTEGSLDEDSLENPSSDESASGVEDMLSDYGFRRMGGGYNGGELNFRNEQGDIITIGVHMMRPENVIGWKAKIGGKTQQGRDVGQLYALVKDSQGNEKRRLLDRSRRGNSMREMSSGGAVASGAVASSAAPMGGVRKRGGLFADADEDEPGPARTKWTQDEINRKSRHARAQNDELARRGMKSSHPKDIKATEDSDYGGFGYGDKPSRRVVQYKMRIRDLAQNSPTEDQWQSLARTIGRETKLSKEEKRSLMDVLKQAKQGRVEEDNDQMSGDDPCWDGYEMVGHKKKGGKEVPNCVPANESFYGGWSTKRRRN